MLDVFIAYSHRDIDFVRYLLSIKLTSRDREAWADWEDISPTAEWLAEIYSDLDSKWLTLSCLSLP